MYSVLFSHPLVETITTWDPVDDCRIKAPSGVMYADNTTKPVYNKLMELIHKDRTTEAEVTANADGYATFTGFKCEYRAETEGGSAEFTLGSVNEKEIELKIRR